MRVLTIPFLFIVAASFGQVTKKTLDLPPFHSIYVNSNYTVYVKQTNKQEVSVEALSDVYSITTILVDDSVLMINVERKPDNANKSVWAKIDDIKISPTLNVYVSMKNITNLQVNGGGKIISQNSIAAPNLDLLVSGSGSMDVDIKGEKVKAKVSGSGSLAIRGYATSLTGDVSGSGALNAFNCPLDKVEVTLSGSGTAEVNASQTANALVTGSGTVKIKGNTKNLTQKVYGSGSVSRAY
jgi:Putative auto-transporter adhesin, head GIN domain